MSEKVLNDFNEYLLNRKEFSANTINSYDRDLKKIFLYLAEKGYDTDDYSWLNEQFIIRYIDYLKEKNYSSATLSRTISTVHIFVEYLWYKKIIPNRVNIDVHIDKQEHQDLVVFTRQEIAKILDVKTKNLMGYRDKAIFELSYSDFCKIKYPYISSYKNPPLWVIIDTLMLNDLLVLFQGLDIAIQNKIMSEMGFDSSISGSREKFINACEILRELRNQLAHFGLITRYRTGNSILINRLFISDLLLTPKRNNRVLKFYQGLKILNSFNRFSLKRIDRAIQSYYLKNMLLLKFDINKNFFNRIGK